MWSAANRLCTTLPFCGYLSGKRAHHQPEHRMSPQPLGKRHGWMTDCCTWLSSSLTRLLLRFLPVSHFATRKMQPMYGHLTTVTSPMWHCALTANVLLLLLLLLLFDPDNQFPGKRKLCYAQKKYENKLEWSLIFLLINKTITK